MPYFGCLSLYRRRDDDVRNERRMANRPHRGKRTNVKAARKQRLRAAR